MEQYSSYTVSSSNLPLIELIRRSDVNTIVNLLQTRKDYAKILNDPELWYYLVERDYGFKRRFIKSDPRQHYIELKSNSFNILAQSYRDIFDYDEYFIQDNQLITFMNCTTKIDLPCFDRNSKKVYGVSEKGKIIEQISVPIYMLMYDGNQNVIYHTGTWDFNDNTHDYEYFDYASKPFQRVIEGYKQILDYKSAQVMGYTFIFNNCNIIPGLWNVGYASIVTAPVIFFYEKADGSSLGHSNLRYPLF